MSLVARFIGADEVIEAYQKKGKPNFSMWCKTAIVCQYNGNDMEEGEEMIREEIDRNVKRKFGHECFLKIHDQQENNYTLKSPVYYNIVFKSYDSPEFSTMASPANFNYALMEKLNGIESRLNAFENDDDDIEDDEQEPDNNQIISGVDSINKLLDHPLVSKFMDLLINRNNQVPGMQEKKLQSLAGVPLEQQQQILNKAIEKLFQKGVTLEHFVALSNMPKEQIISLLNFLK